MAEARAPHVEQARGNAEPLSKVVYRSRAVAGLSGPELHGLAAQAQARNRREAVTGLMLYDDRRFYQWLEGPAGGVGRLMHSIRNDTRHTDIEILDERAARSRKFVGWDMKLAARGPERAFAAQDVLEPPPEVLETLRKRPEAAPVMLAKLVPGALRPAAAAAAAADAPMRAKTAAILTQVMLSTVIPTLISQRSPAGSGRRTNNRAPELADLLVSADPDAAMQLIAELRDGQSSVQPLYAELFEPAARSLGDRWADDDCTEAEVTLALCRLQSAARLLSHGTPVRPPQLLPQPVVLVAPEPGEMHGLGAALDTEVLWGAGWAPRSEHPSSEAALHDMLAGLWVDVLDLSLSAAFRREHMLPRMAQTIADARRASRNPALLVVVGGRVFVEEQAARLQVGADVASATSTNVDRLILRSARSAGWTSGGSPQAAADPGALEA